MYCVKCGVKLQDGVSVCPLCNTKMHFEEDGEVEASYSDIMPTKDNPNIAAVSILSAFFLIACLIIMIVCLNLYHQLSWGGYVIASIIAFYIIFIFPAWFIKTSPIIFASLDFATIALLLLYINVQTGGHWFLSFAFPIVIITASSIIVALHLRKKIKKAGFFIFGGLFISSGLFCMLIEMFECITFNTKMFTWSLYVVSSTTIIGIFLLLCGIIKPLKEVIVKRFFI